MSKFSFLATAAVLILEAAAATCAYAQSNEQMSVRVSYRDLNLSQPAGQATLDRRIHAAAQEVCGLEPSYLELASGTEYRQCVRDAEKGAKFQESEAIASANGGDTVRIAQVGTGR